MTEPTFNGIIRNGKIFGTGGGGESGGSSESWLTSIPEMHRNIFRGKSLGDHVTAAQFAAVVDHSFDDLYVGDYWDIPVTIDGTEISVNWRIADIDYLYNCSYAEFTAHHLVIVPDTILYKAQMNTTNTTDGGYAGSKMRTTYLDKAKTAINAAFPGMVLTHKEYLVDAVSNGKPSAGTGYDSTVELMSEVMVYGHKEYSPGNDAATNPLPVFFTLNKTQLALFRMAPMFIQNGEDTTLRDIVSNTSYARVDGRGLVHYIGAIEYCGVRPYFLIGAAEE